MNKNQRRAIGLESPIDVHHHAAIGSLLLGLKIEPPRPAGGRSWFGAVMGGITFPIDPYEQSRFTPGAEVGAWLGYRWNYVGLALGGSYMYDPRALLGRNHIGKIGWTFRVRLPIEKSTAGAVHDSGYQGYAKIWL